MGGWGGGGGEGYCCWDLPYWRWCRVGCGLWLLVYCMGLAVKVVVGLVGGTGLEGEGCGLVKRVEPRWRCTLYLLQYLMGGSVRRTAPYRDVRAAVAVCG